MVYTETIQLQDDVTPAAAKAQRSLADLDKGLAVVTKSLASAEGIAGKFAKPLTQPLNASTPAASVTAPMMAAPSPMAGAGAAGATAAMPAMSGAPSGADFATLATQAEAAKRATEGLRGSVQGATASTSEYGDSLGQVGDELRDVAQPMPPLQLNAEGLAAAREVAAGLADELKETQAEMLKAQALGDADGFAEASKKADDLRGSLAKLPAPAQTASKTLSQSFADAAHAAEVGASTIGAAMSGIKGAFSALAAGDVKGAIAGVTESVAGMAKMLDMVVPGLGQAVSLVITIAGGLVGITAGLAVSASKFAIAANEAQLATDGMFEALGQGAITAGEVGDMLDGLRTKLGVSSGAMEPIVQKLMLVGITGTAALEQVTTAAVSMDAIMRGAGASFTELYTKVYALAEAGESIKMPFKELQTSLAKSGLNVKDIAKEMGVAAEDLVRDLNAGTVNAKKFGDAMTEAAIKKGAGPLKTLANSAANLGELVNEYLGELFEDLGDSIGPFMDEVKSLFGIFDSKTNPSGQAMKAAIGGALKEIFAVATKAVPLIKHFLLDVIIYSLKAYIALKPAVKAIKEFFASETGAAFLSLALDTIVSAMKAIGVVILVIVGLFTVMAVATVTVATAIWGAIGALVSLSVAIASAIQGALSSAITALTGWVTSAQQIGTDFIAGLVAGITGGISKVTGAVTGLAGSALGAIKGVFDSNSPSKVMLSMGQHDIAGALATGIDAGSLDVHGAASTMASSAVSGASASSAPSAAVAATAAAAQTAGGGNGGSGGQMVVTFEPGAIQISGQGKDWSEVTEEMMAGVMERLAMQAGVG